MIVIAMVGLIGVVALVIDGGFAYVERGRIQTAADAAALAGAIARVENADWRAYALASAKTNGYDNNGTTNTVELNTPPTSGPFADNPEYIQVIITSRIKTYFGPAIGVPEIVVSTQAIAQTKPAEYGQMFDGYSIVSLAPTSKCDVDNKRAFYIHGEATLAIEGGGVFVNSNNSECAIIQKGSGSIRILDDSPISVVGGESIQKPQLFTPYPIQTGAVPINYPPAFQMPKAGCGSKEAEVIDEEGTTMSPGNWGETFPPEGVTHLEPGIYCLDGDVKVEGLLSGTDVVLYIKNGSAQFSGGAEINLSAPKGGDLQGLLIYMPLGNKNRLTLNGNDNSAFRGTILAPSADLHLNGMGSSEGFHSQIIGYYIDVDGQDIIQIKYKDEQNFDAYRMPEVLLSD